MSHSFSSHGRTYTIRRHPQQIARLRQGTITQADVDASPWQLCWSVGGHKRSLSLRTPNLNEARALARRLAREHDSELECLLESLQRRRGITVAQIAADYIAAGYPDAYLIPRTGASKAEQARRLRRALDWWGPRPAAGIDLTFCDQYFATRNAECSQHRQGGRRSVDLELVALSNCLAWGVRTGRIATNPLAGRPQYRRPAAADNHRLYQPETDEELHALARCLLDDGGSFAVSGARLLLIAMTGLRPGETCAIEWMHPGLLPGSPGYRQHVHRPDGDAEFFHIRRSKHGQNPAVRMHPALRDFLAAWELSCPSSRWMFPGLDPDHHVPNRADGRRDPLSHHLRLAVKRVNPAPNRWGHTRRTPHALRAFYVSARRSQGILDAEIAMELGQGSGAQLIVTTYGEPTDVFGSGRLDWLPADSAPAWSLLLPKGCTTS